MLKPQDGPSEQPYIKAIKVLFTFHAMYLPYVKGWTRLDNSVEMWIEIKNYRFLIAMIVYNTNNVNIHENVINNARGCF